MSANNESIAHRLESACHRSIREHTDPQWQSVQCTPSVLAGRRFLGVKAEGKQFLVTILVEDLEDEANG